MYMGHVQEAIQLIEMITLTDPIDIYHESDLSNSDEGLFPVYVCYGWTSMRVTPDSRLAVFVYVGSEYYISSTWELRQKTNMAKPS